MMATHFAIKSFKETPKDKKKHVFATAKIIPTSPKIMTAKMLANPYKLIISFKTKTNVAAYLHLTTCSYLFE